MLAKPITLSSTHLETTTPYTLQVHCSPCWHLYQLLLLSPILDNNLAIPKLLVENFVQVFAIDLEKP
jgi:hypothetical protein